MNAVEFVSKFGWLISKVFVENWSELAVYYGFDNKDLKRLVESWESVEKHGGLIGAKKEAEKLEWSNQSEWYNKLIKAIADVESVEGGV